MIDQEVYNAYAGAITIEALLYENFDDKPQWKQVKIKNLRISMDGVESVHLMILENGWPTPWDVDVKKEKFATDLREVQKTVEGSIARPITDEGRLLK